MHQSSLLKLLNIYLLPFQWVPVLALIIYSNSVHTVPKYGTKPIRYATLYLRNQRGAWKKWVQAGRLVQERTRWRHAAHPFVSSARYFQAPSTQANAVQPHSITEIAPPQPFLCVNRSPIRYDSVADPGVFLGGGALVSCSTSTPINHSYFFFAEYQLY